jgi:hypothetical protein
VIISFFAPTVGIWALLLLFPTQILAARLPRKALPVGPEEH